MNPRPHQKGRCFSLFFIFRREVAEVSVRKSVFPNTRKDHFKTRFE